MARTTYHVTLSLDGDHRVSVTSDDQTELSEGLAWAKGVVLKLEAYAREHAEAEQVEEEPPICDVHQLPMVKVQGRKGEFWSCHEKNEDGSWCSYKPPVQ
jgi:hypothetical protein